MIPGGSGKSSLNCRWQPLVLYFEQWWRPRHEQQQMPLVRVVYIASTNLTRVLTQLVSVSFVHQVTQRYTFDRYVLLTNNTSSHGLGRLGRAPGETYTSFDFDAYARDIMLRSRTTTVRNMVSWQLVCDTINCEHSLCPRRPPPPPRRNSLLRTRLRRWRPSLPSFGRRLPQPGRRPRRSRACLSVLPRSAWLSSTRCVLYEIANMNTVTYFDDFSSVGFYRTLK